MANRHTPGCTCCGCDYYNRNLAPLPFPAYVNTEEFTISIPELTCAEPAYYEECAPSPQWQIGLLITRKQVWDSFFGWVEGDSVVGDKIELVLRREDDSLLAGVSWEVITHPVFPSQRAAKCKLFGSVINEIEFWGNQSAKGVGLWYSCVWINAQNFVIQSNPAAPVGILGARSLVGNLFDNDYLTAHRRLTAVVTITAPAGSNIESGKVFAAKERKTDLVITTAECNYPPRMPLCPDLWERYIVSTFDFDFPGEGTFTMDQLTTNNTPNPSTKVKLFGTPSQRFEYQIQLSYRDAEDADCDYYNLLTVNVRFRRQIFDGGGFVRQADRHMVWEFEYYSDDDCADATFVLAEGDALSDSWVGTPIPFTFTDITVSLVV